MKLHPGSMPVQDMGKLFLPCSEVNPRSSKAGLRNSSIFTCIQSFETYNVSYSLYFNIISTLTNYILEFKAESIGCKNDVSCRRALKPQ